MLIKPTLILNTDGKPLQIINWHKAITALFKGQVKTLRNYDNMVIHDGKGNPYPIPAVVVTTYYVKKYRTKPKLSKRNIFVRDKCVCAYCGTKCVFKELTVDHIIPRAKGGTSSWLNLITSCKSCNHRKGDNTNVKPRYAATEPKNIGVFIVHDAPAEWQEFIYEL